MEYNHHNCGGGNAWLQRPVHGALDQLAPRAAASMQLARGARRTEIAPIQYK